MLRMQQTRAFCSTDLRQKWKEDTVKGFNSKKLEMFRHLESEWKSSGNYYPSSTHMEKQNKNLKKPSHKPLEAGMGEGAQVRAKNRSS